jgi:hypothetical protein
MTKSDFIGVIVVWLMIVIVSFGVGFSIVIWAERQNIWVVEVEDGTTTLEVKPNTGLQTDQYTPIQPAVNPIGKEL